MKLGLEEKVVLVTASSKGLGYAIAESMVQEGAKVAISSRDPKRLEEAAKELSQKGKHSVFFYPADLSKLDEVDGLMDAVFDHFGRIDILINNTGGPPTADFIDTTREDWEMGLHMMLYPVLQMTKRAIPSMKENGGGRIIYMTSTWVKQPRKSGVISTMFRSAISGLSKHLSNELAPYNILVNQIMPGPTWTDRSKEITSRLAKERGVSVEEVKEGIRSEIPLGRYASAEEIADVVTFIASDRASFVTGTSIQVDGGQIKSVL